MAQQTASSLKSKALGDLNAGKLPQALKKAQLGIKKFPKDADYYAIAGFVLTEMKRYKQSIPHFAEASKIKPDDPQFAENLANALMQSGQIPRALSYAEQKLARFPNSKELLRIVDEIQLKGQNWRLIIDYSTKKLEADPDNASVLANRARAYEKIGFLEDSTRDIDRAFELSPRDNSIALQKAMNLRQKGEEGGCIKVLRDILRTEPHHPSALYQLSLVSVSQGLDELLSATDQAIAEAEQPDSVLEFARAQLLSKRDGLAAALPQFSHANAVQHENNPYDPGKEEADFARICDLFPKDQSFATTDQTQSPDPIFVIGQPRSGTTLMEMMLSTASSVASCGELTLAADLSRPFVENEKPFDISTARAFAQEFRELMPPIPKGSAAFVDKMPHNYQRVGFLLSAFPNARIVNMMRDPRDVGLSKWIRRFPAPGMRYASDLTAIAHSANLYRKYMAHWDQVFGGRILTVPYEDLVADPETHSRRVAGFCDITWHAQMMHPEENTRQVRTASIDQVRQKISTKSIGGWRKVADQIQPMLDGFDPALWPEYDLG